MAPIGPQKHDAKPVWLLLCVLALLGLQLSGCAVGPEFVTPAPPKVDRYTSAPIDQTASAPVAGGEAQKFLLGGDTTTQWWKAFGSEHITALVKQAVAQNPTIASAQAALRQAQETLNAGYGNLYPSVDATLSSQRQKTTGASFGQPATGTNTFNLHNASVNVSYGLDIFGGVRRMLEAQKAVIEYQQFELEATYQTLAANVVTTAVAEASLQAQVEATKDILADEQKLFAVTERQFALGSISRADVAAARSNLASTEATLVTLEKQLAATENQLTAYLGQFPAERTAKRLTLDELTLPQDIPLTLPSELVQRRPDVRAAEALLHEASAQIGVGSANMFRKIALNASYGGQSAAWSKLFDENIWSVGAAITQPLFHGGALAAQKRVAIAAYDQALANYRQTVLMAFTNVADSLNALEGDARILKARHEAAAAAEERLSLVQVQFRLGSASYLDLLSAQKQYQQGRIDYLQALASRYQDTAALFLSMSGGLPDETLREAGQPEKSTP